MRLLFSVSFSLLLTIPVLCQIHITTHEIWQSDTIKVDQNIIVNEGGTLTISAGTVVLFVDQNFIDVYGELYINGTEGDSVILTAIDSTWIEVNSLKQFYGWGGIYAYNNGIVKAKYAVFEKLGYSHHSKNGNAMFGVLRNESTNALEFEHCRFELKRDSQQTYDGCAIEGNGGDIIIKSSIFKNNTGSGSLVYINNQGSLSISKTTFSNNNIVGYMINAPGAVFSIESSWFANNKTRALLFGITYNGSSFVDRNIFKNNQGAVHLQGVYADIYFRNNHYENNGGQIYFWLGRNVITGNVFLGNYYSDPYDFFGNDYDGIVRIENTELSGPIIVNNSFINNRAFALSLWATNTFNIGNNIFHNNYPLDTSLPVSVEYLNSAGRNFQYNLSNEFVPGPGNQAGNPRLVNAQDGFLLSPNSPAINSGTSSLSGYLLPTDLLGNPRENGQIDIGAVEFQDSYVALTSITISDTVLTATTINQEVARFSTISEFNLTEIRFILSNENGMNNDYFMIDEDKLILKKELTTEKLLRIKVRAEHVSGAWVEDYYYLTVPAVIVGVEKPAENKMLVFPIPTDRLLYIGDFLPGMTYEIFSVTGTNIQSGSLNTSSIDVSGLADGIYILKLFNGNRVDRIKFHKYSQ